MGWTAEFLEGENVIELKVEGSLDSDEVLSSTDDAIAISSETGCQRVLLDCKNLEHAPAASVVQKLPDYYKSRGLDSRLRIALINSGSEAGRQISRYYKVSAQRLRYTVQLFDDREDALRWLTA